MAHIPDPDRFLRDLFACAVARADPMLCVPDHLPPKPAGRVVVLGAGKASARMAEAVEAAWGPCAGLVITRYGYGRPCQGIEIVEAAHPVPDAAGVAATRRMLALAESLSADDTVVMLISGGGSALLCAPAGGITLGDKQALGAAMLASGMPIGAMNSIRKELSQVKGGRLAAAIYPAKLLCLMISDVPGDEPGDIASGPTVGYASDVAGAVATLAKWRVAVPPAIAAYLAAGGAPVAQDTCLSGVQNTIIAAPSHSLAAAAKVARAAGVEVRILGDAIEGEARDLAGVQAAMALDLAAQGLDFPVLLLSGGECTVTRGAGTGVGGPNAEFALAMAVALRGHPKIHAIACDTDGVDGGAEVAGAVVGPETLARAGAKGLNAQDQLDAHNAHGFFAAIDAQVVSGPTLTNVNDFRAILVMP